MTVRVVLADDQPLIRAALQMVISDAADLELVGEAATGLDAVQLVGELDPDVVVMDIRMPVMDGIEATRLIAQGSSGASVIVLTTFDEDDYVYGALRAGASGFLVKDMALDDILTAIRVVAAGDALIAPGVTRRLIETFANHPAPDRAQHPGPDPRSGPVSSSRSGPVSGSAPHRASDRASGELEGVTEREREVLTLIARGLTNSEIAADLVISVATVKAYVGRLLTKLDARDRVQLVILAYEAGLVAPSK
ncbi:response regulator transcription factor [Nonomuraea fuscirosea]|uniref:response regulator transcription factor n=1 Tax=Nonomuraea fuscirosea TaxID=1291556 RepID=UPI002DDBB203|nr:response regulator transcription factor [Nonomuraea fuscirosea]WSA54898.1 response regulator transcription factor [Nonomuraea fuscirosea]